MGTLHKNLTGDELHIGKTNVGTGDPNGSVTAGVIGELFWDSTNNKLYVAEAADNASWIASSDAFDEWIELSDTPGTISAGLNVQGNSGGTALEFGQNLTTTGTPTFSELKQGGVTILIGNSSNSDLLVGLGAGAAQTTGTGLTAVGNNALLANTTGDDNTAVGGSAMLANLAGGENTALGVSALAANTSGNNNDAIGFRALTLNTTGSANTAVGNGTLDLNTTGSDNTAVGVSALAFNILGRRNTAIGVSSGLNIASAALTGENTLVGYNTGLGITTGVQNTVLGANVSGLSAALSNNIILADGAGVTRLQFDSSGDGSMGGNLTVTGTINNMTVFGDISLENTIVGRTAGATGTGFQHVAVGDGALNANTTGVRNTAIGYQALLVNLTGSDNTAVGKQALFATTSGGDNTAVGREALRANTEGVLNAAFGTGALLSNTTGDSNLALGCNALSAVVDGEQNTAVGDSSGFDVISPSGTGNNTFLGFNSGRGIITGINNTVLGANITGLTSTLSNNVILADGAGNIRLQFDSSGDGTIGGGLQVTGAFKDTSGDAGTSGQVLSSTVAGTNWIDVAAAGDVSSVGTPVDNQVAIWASASTIEGDTGLTFDGAQLLVANGTVSLPAVGFVSDTGTGMYRSAARTIGFTSDGDDILKVAATTTTVASHALITNDYDDVNEIAQVFYGVDSTDALVDVFLEAKASQVFINSGATAGAVQIGRINSAGKAHLQVELLGGVAVGQRANAVTTTGNLLTMEADSTAGFTRTRFQMISPGDNDEFTIGVNRVSAGGEAFIQYTDGTDILIDNSAGTAISISSLAVSIPGSLGVTGAFLDSSGDAGTNGQMLESTVTGTNWTSAGAGDVLVSGTPVDNQLAVWTDSTTIEGDAGLTYTGSLFIAIGGGTNVGGTIAEFRNSANSQRLMFNDETTTGSLPAMIESVTGFGLGFSASSGSAPVIFYAGGKTTSDEAMRITSALLVGVGTTSPDTKLHALSTGADTTAVLTLETTGSNLGEYKTFVGSRDPSGNITGAGGDIYVRDQADQSGTYESLEATTGTAWFKRMINPTDVIQINTSAEFEALATASVITISSTTLIWFNVSISTSTVFVLSGGATLVLRGHSRVATLTFTGTGTLITGTGSVDINDLGLTSSSTGTFLGFTQSAASSVTRIGNSPLIGWDDLGSITKGNVFIGIFPIINASSGWTFTNTATLSLFRMALIGAPLSSALFTIKTNLLSPFIDARNMSIGALSATGSVFDFDVASSDGATLAVATVKSATGALFKQTTLTDATFTAVADSVLANGTITAQATNSDSQTTHSSTTTYFEGELVTITGTTSYNGTFRIFNVVASTSFDTPTTFVANDATGTVATDRLAVTLAASHGISAADNVKIIDANFYNGFYVALNFPSTNSMIINGAFTSTDTGSVERVLSLDQSDPRVLATNNPGFVGSKYIACAHVNDNSTATGTIVNNTFTDMVFGTAADALSASTTMERWRLVDELNGTFGYFGNEPFDGLITFDFTVESSGGTVDFRFKWQISTDGGSSFSDIADTVEALVAVGSDAQSVTKTFPISASSSNQIKPQITRNSGSSGITTTYATIYATQ